LESDIAWGEPARRDARTDHRDDEQTGSVEFGREATDQIESEFLVGPVAHDRGALRLFGSRSSNVHLARRWAQPWIPTVLLGGPMWLAVTVH
jgi:hypothetical protein